MSETEGLIRSPRTHGQQKNSDCLPCLRFGLSFIVSLLLAVELASELSRDAALTSTPLFYNGATVYSIDSGCDYSNGSKVLQCNGLWSCARNECTAFSVPSTLWAAIRIRPGSSVSCEESFTDALTRLWQNYRLFQSICILIGASLFIQLCSFCCWRCSRKCMALFWVLGKLALIAAAIVNIILSKSLEDVDAPPEFATKLALTAHIAFIVGVSLETILTACELHHSGPASVKSSPVDDSELHQSSSPELEADAFKDELRRRKEELIQTTKSIQESNDQLQTLKSEVASASEQLKATENTVRSTETALKSVQAQLRTSSASYQKAQADLEALQKKLAELHLAVDAKQRELAGVETQLEASRTRHTKAQEELGLVQGKLAATKRELELLEAQRAAHQREAAGHAP